MTTNEHLSGQSRATACPYCGQALPVAGLQCPSCGGSLSAASAHGGAQAGGGSVDGTSHAGIQPPPVPPGAGGGSPAIPPQQAASTGFGQSPLHAWNVQPPNVPMAPGSAQPRKSGGAVIVFAILGAVVGLWGFRLVQNAASSGPVQPPPPMADDFRRVEMDQLSFVGQVLRCRISGPPQTPEAGWFVDREYAAPRGSKIARIACGDSTKWWEFVVPPDAQERYLQLRSGDVVRVRISKRPFKQTVALTFE